MVGSITLRIEAIRESDTSFPRAHSGAWAESRLAPVYAPNHIIRIWPPRSIQCPQPAAFPRTHRPLRVQEDASELQDQRVGRLIVRLSQRVWEKAGASGLDDHLWYRDRMGAFRQGAGGWGMEGEGLGPGLLLTCL